MLVGIHSSPDREQGIFWTYFSLTRNKSDRNVVQNIKETIEKCVPV